MDGILQIVLLLVLTASIVLQVFTVFLGFRLARMLRSGGILLPVALLLMAVRRLVTFGHLLDGGVIHLPDMTAEVVAFFVSLLLAAGLMAFISTMNRQRSPFKGIAGLPSDELFENMTAGIAVFQVVDKGRDFRIVDINPAAEQIEKLTRELAAGRLLSEVFPDMDEPSLPDVLRRVWKTGHPESLPMHYYKNERVSGWRDYFVYRRAGGELVAVYSDVSIQMKMQKEMERREHKFCMLLEQAPLPYLVLDSAGNIREVNPAWLRLAGMDRLSVAGQPFRGMLSIGCREKFQVVLEELQRKGTVADLKLELLPKTGPLLPVKLTALAQCGRTGGIEQIDCMMVPLQPERDAGEVEQQMPRLAREMQEEGRRELRQQRIAMFGDLIGGMASVLNAPLAAARNAFNLMRQNISPTSPHYEFAGIAARELARMAEMVEQMYRFRDPISQGCEKIHINAMLDNTLVLLRRLMKDHHVEVRDERAPDLPPVFLPPGAVMLALINPVKNSLEAMRTGGILTLRTGAAATGGVFVEIEDNGPGIPQDFMPRLFEPFVTLRHGGLSGGGIGLGMAQLLHVLNIIGGTVTVDSSVGRGTLVRITLPVRMPADA